MVDNERSRLFLERLARFSDTVNNLCKNLPKDPINFEITPQLIRSGGSIGANYIEALESLSKKDFYYRIRICRKESRESEYWLNRLLKNNPQLINKITPLQKEGREFVLIFSKVLLKAND